MPSKSQRDIECLKIHVEGIIQTLNNQAQQISKLTKTVVLLHAELHPDHYHTDGSPKTTEELLNDNKDKDGSIAYNTVSSGLLGHNKT